MQSANWVSAKNGLCVVQTTEINEFGTGCISSLASGANEFFLFFVFLCSLLLLLILLVRLRQPGDHPKVV